MTDAHETISGAPPLGLAVRLAREADTPAIARIHNQGIADRVATFETEPRTPEALAAQLRERGDRYPTVVAERAGAGAARLIASAEDIDWRWFDGVTTLGLTAGASAPETLVQGVIAACRARFNVTVQEVVTAQEDVVFRIPRVFEGA